MDSDTLAKLGTPFFTTKDTGTGLGLVIGFELVKKLKGVLTVESEPEKGTTITIKFFT